MSRKNPESVPTCSTKDSASPVSYTHSDAADEEDSVDLGGRRIIIKKTIDIAPLPDTRDQSSESRELAAPITM